MSATRSLKLTLLAAAFSAQAAFGADVANGKAVFDRLCTTCHATSNAPGGPVIGPTLAGIVGRKSASVKDFSMYTPAMKGYNVTWNASTLDEFLANPITRVPGSMMVMPVPDAKERTDLIAYLSTLKAKK